MMMFITFNAYSVDIGTAGCSVGYVTVGFVIGADVGSFVGVLIGSDIVATVG